MRKLKLTELNRKGVTEFKETQKMPVIVVLDNLRSALNIGSIFRTSDAFLIEKIILTGICAIPPHHEIRKTAIGAEESMEWEYIEHIEAEIQRLKSSGYFIYGIEQTDKSQLLQEIKWQFPCVILLGNEVGGIKDTLLPFIDQAVEIPQEGTKHSLNVAVCGGIVLWEVYKGRGV